MRLWIIADTHFNHEKLIEYGRPKNFEGTIKRNLFRGNFAPDDVLLHLGDVCIGKEIENNEWFHENLTCKLWLVRGNHDKRGIGWYLEHGWDFCADKIQINMYGYRVCFTHEPISKDDSFDLNIHGHQHECKHRTCTEEGAEFRRLISLDYTNFKPVLLSAKYFIMNKRSKRNEP
jgi:calcineurin-like phosphoesterase family protein